MKIGKIIPLTKINDPRGDLTVVEALKDLPFTFQRVYWTYGVPEGESRGGHAHKHCRELIVAANGSFSVTLDNTIQKEKFLMDRPDRGLLVERGVWRTLENFSAGAVCLVIAEDPFTEEDYIREYGEYLQFTACLRQK